jgi:hypothetical protein
MRGPHPDDEKLLRELVLVFELNGAEGVVAHARNERIPIARCEALLERELIGRDDDEER